MVTRKIFRKLIGIALVTAFILSAYNTAATTVAPAPARTASPLPVLPSATATNVLVATETPIPTIASNPADTPTYQTQSTQGSANNPPTTPSVSDRYPLPHVTSKGFGLITTPGKVWVGSANGMVDVLDAKSGQVLQSIALFPGSGGITGQPVFDLKFDGQHVWDLAGSGTRMKPDTLFAIDAASGTVLRQFDTSEWAGSLEQKLGFSPGKIWVSHQTIDTRTFEVQYNVVPWGDYYAYDGKGWMWIIRDMNEACMPILSVVNADDPSQRYEAMKGDLHMDPCDRPITLIGDRMWVAGYAHPENNPAPVLWAYPADG
ncbi:MAG: hypothetical protein ABSF99_14060, partial [Anaerolineales bacterium]